jgi:hypothetical protein
VLTRRQTLIVVGTATLGVLPLLLPRQPDPVHLTEQQAELDADPDQVFDQLTSFDQGPRIVQRSANQIIAEFPISVGWYRVTTLERITLDADRRRVTFEQLRSPFFSVQSATEVFELLPRPGGGTVITLRGTLWPRLGLFGWLMTLRVVRPRWDAIDAKALARLREHV